jgi:hypothetical protein
MGTRSSLLKQRKGPPGPFVYAASVRNGFEDWWLDERFDSVGLTEEDVPATVE